MDTLIISKSDLQKFIDELIKKNIVYAPVENNGTILFEQIKKANEAKLDYNNSQYPPKALIFNQTETLLKFKPGPKGDIEPIKVDEKKIIFGGSRTVDALGIKVLETFDYVDFIVSGDGEDALYLA